MKALVVFGLSLLFTSCMQFGMMGMRATHGASDHSAASDPQLEKEVISGQTRAAAVFPPLYVGKEATFTLKLTDARTGEPLSRAKVSFHVSGPEAEDDHRMNEMHKMHEPADSSHQHSSQHDRWDLEEGSQPGVYSATFNASEAGIYRIMFRINTSADADSEITVGGMRHAMQENQGHSGGMMWSLGSQYAVVGAVVMATAMIVVWVARGGHMSW